jgi:hypothetical protein
MGMDKGEVEVDIILVDRIRLKIGLEGIPLRI